MSGAVLDQKPRYSLIDELASSFIDDNMTHYHSFIQGIKNGLKDYRQGKMRPWDDVKKELGYG